MNTIDYTQLGAIGAKAAYQILERDYLKIAVSTKSQHWTIHETARTAYAEAVVKACLEQVREAVERQQVEEIARLTAELEEASRDWLNHKEEIQNTKNELAMFQKSYEAERNCSAERMAKIHAHEEEIRRLTARSAGQLLEITSLHHLLDEGDAEYAEVKADLERLQWRPVSMAPTAEDADATGNVETITPEGRMMLRKFSSWPWAAHEVTHWRPFCPPPAPTPEEAEQERFEKWALKNCKELTPLGDHDGANYKDIGSQVAFQIWQAARAVKEGE